MVAPLSTRHINVEHSMSDSGVNERPDVNGDEPDAGQPKLSPGAQLAAYREERGWTIEQVASQLNLAPRQIAAIEHDDYPALPGMPIVRGFIRAYAKLLKVDSAPLLAGLGGETVLAHDSITPRQPLSMPFSETRLPSMMERPGLSSKWILGGLLAVLLGVAIWAARHEDNIAGMSKSTSSPVKDGVANIAGPDANQPQGAKTEEQNVMPPPETANAQAPAAVPPSAAPAAAAPSPVPAAASGKDTLQLKVREDSWIEVRRIGSGGIVLSRIVKAGETEHVEVTEPVSVVIGNAAGVEATLRGAPVELKASTNSNVARLTLK
jgi:cytoskeleton protein RodZ